MSANIICVVYVKILCAVCMQTCGVYASRCGVYAITCGVYASTCGVYEYLWCLCIRVVCMVKIMCGVYVKIMCGVYVKYIIKLMLSVYVSACCVCRST